MNDLATTIVKRQEQLAVDRAQWEKSWQEIADLVLPRRGDFAARRLPGEQRTDRLFDSTALQANELLASALNGLLTNPQAKWFHLRPADDRLVAADGVRDWLESVEERMLRVFNGPDARFALAAHELYLDLGAFGTAGMFIGELADGLLFRTHHLTELFVAENAIVASTTDCAASNSRSKG